VFRTLKKNTEKLTVRQKNPFLSKMLETVAELLIELLIN